MWVSRSKAKYVVVFHTFHLLRKEQKWCISILKRLLLIMSKKNANCVKIRLFINETLGQNSKLAFNKVGIITLKNLAYMQDSMVVRLQTLEKWKIPKSWRESIMFSFSPFLYISVCLCTYSNDICLKIYFFNRFYVHSFFFLDYITLDLIFVT